MSAETSTCKTLFDGMCKVQQPSSSGQVKKGIFGRVGSSEILPWKLRYCLLSQSAVSDGDAKNPSVSTLTVYKSKKILRTNATHSAKICCSIQIDSQVTVLSEDMLSNFVFHLDKHNTTVSFSCETQFIRDSWVSTISQIQTAGVSPTLDVPQNNACPSLDGGVDEDERKRVADIGPSVSGKENPPTLPVASQEDSVGGGSETTRIQLRREQSLPTYLGGLELECIDDKPASKSSSSYLTNRRGNLSVHQMGVSEGHILKSPPFAKSTELDVPSISPILTTPSHDEPVKSYGHPSAKLPSKPTLPRELEDRGVEERGQSVRLVVDNRNLPSQSPLQSQSQPQPQSKPPPQSQLQSLSQPQTQSPPQAMRDQSGPMWLNYNKEKQSKPSLVDTSVQRDRVDQKRDKIKGMSSTSEEKHNSNDFFFTSTSGREKNFGIPYSVFDMDSLSASQDFDDIYPRLGKEKRSTSPATLQHTQSVAARTVNIPIEGAPLFLANAPTRMTASGRGIDESLLSDVDHDKDQVMLLAPEQDSEAISQLHLRREIKSLVELNNELRANMEHSSEEARRRREQDHKLALTMQSEVKELSISNRSLAERNDHLTEKIKVMSADMEDLDKQCQEKDRLCLKYESELDTLESYKKLTESLTRDNTDLLSELDKVQSFAQKGVSHEASVSKELRILQDELRSIDVAQAKSEDKLREAEAVNATLARQNHQLRDELAAMTSSFQVSDQELKTLRSRFDSEVLDEVSQEAVKNYALEIENVEFKRKENEYDTLKHENARLLRELDEQKAIVKNLSADANAESFQKLSKAVIDVTVERDEYMRRLSDKQDSLVELESKMVDEEKKVFQLTMIVEELQDDKKRSKASLETVHQDYKKDIDALSVNYSKVTNDYTDLMERCSSYKAQLRDAEDEVRREYENRLQERKEFNLTRLDMEDAMSRESSLSKRNQIKIEELEREKDSLNREILDHQAVVVSLKSKIADLTHSLDDTSSLLTVEQRKNRSLVSESEFLQNNMENLKTNSAASLQQLQNKVDELEQALNSSKMKLQEAVQQLKEKKKDFKTNTTELTDSLQDADARCKTISEEASKIQRARKRENEEAARELAEAHDKIKNLTAKLDAANSDIKLKSLEIGSYLEKVTRLQIVADNKQLLDKKFAEMQLKCNQSDMDLVTLKDKLVFFENTAKQNQACIEKRDVTIAGLEENCRDFKSIIADLKHGREQDENVNGQLCAEKGLLQQRAEEVCLALNTCETSLRAKISQCEEVTAQLGNTKVELGARKEEIAQLCATISSLRDSMAAGEVTISRLAGEKSELQGEVLTLSRKIDSMASLENKIEEDTEKLLTVQSECDLLRTEVEHIKKLKVVGDECIARLEVEVAELPELKRQLSILSGIDVEKGVLEKKMEEVEQRNSDYESAISECTTKEQNYRSQIADLQKQANKSRKQCEKKIRATEKALDLQTSDRDLAFRAIQTAVGHLLNGTSLLSDRQESGGENVDQWHDRLRSTKNSIDTELAESGSDSLSSYCGLLKTILDQLSSRCTQFLQRYVEMKPTLMKSNFQNWEAIDTLKTCIAKRGHHSLLLNTENIIGASVQADKDVRVFDRDFCAGLHHSFDMVADILEDFVDSIDLRNSMIEALSRDAVNLCTAQDAMEEEVRRAQAMVYKRETDASKCKREKLALESILRSKMSTQDFYDIMLKQNIINDLDQYSVGSNRKENVERRIPTENPLSPSEEVDFFSSASLTSGLDNEEDDHTGGGQYLQDHDDCASSVSWYSKDGNQCTFPETATNPAPGHLRTGRAARISLRQKGNLPLDGSKVADMFSSDVDFEL